MTCSASPRCSIPDPPNVDPFWTASARSLFLGIALYLFETPSLPKTIGEVLRQGMASDDEGFGQHWKRLIEGRNSGTRPLSSQCVRSLYDVIDLAPVTASSIRKTFTSRLDLWLNPILDAATSESDFDLRELRKKPMSIYVGVNPDDLHRLRPVLNLFFQQAIGLQTRELPERQPGLKYQVMMLLDEFTALGRIPIIAEAISYLPGYNVRVVLVIQTPAQLREVYGIHNAETMLKSLAARIVFAPKDFPDAREISDELGFTTVPVEDACRSPRGGPRSAWAAIEQPEHERAAPSAPFTSGSEGARPRARPSSSTRDCGRSGAARSATSRTGAFASVSCPHRRSPVPFQRAMARAPGDPSEPSRGESARGEAGDSVAPAPRTEKEEVVLRDATVEDVERIESLTLEDFATDFSKVQIPDREGPVSEPEMKAAVDTFLNSLER